MTEQEVIKETRKHMRSVARKLSYAASTMNARAIYHDNSKLESPELEVFVEYTPKLRGVTYGSEEYKQYLKEMQVALDHHYEVNSHHPEHYENGIDGMDLFDILEMFFDWWAATERHADGDMLRSIHQNVGRFNMSDQLFNIFVNTYERHKD